MYFDNDTGFQPDTYQNRNLYFGIREFAEAAAGNGINLYGGSRAFVNTFFIFSDYMKNAIRHASLMHDPYSVMIQFHLAQMVQLISQLSN